jgi:hypothetical protein
MLSKLRTDRVYRLPSMSALEDRPVSNKAQSGKMVAFELDLLEYLNIHLVISCVYPELALPERLELSDRPTSTCR